MKKKLLFAVLILLAAATAGSIVYDWVVSKTVTDDFFAMDTTVSVRYTGRVQQDEIDRIRAAVLHLDTDVLSRTSEKSEIAAVNRGHGGTVDRQTAAWLQTLRELENKSGYAFTADLGALTELWGIGTENERVPDDDEIRAVLAHIKKWNVDGTKVTVDDGAILDLGAVGKGIACDEIKNGLQKTKAKKAIAAVGGSVLLYAKDPNAVFRVGIRDPRGEVNDYAAILTAGSGCISTSGSYERVFTAPDGKAYHHIFDPATGRPARSGLQSVTVLCDSGLLSDALSTACFVLGCEKSVGLLQAYGAKAVFITEDDRVLTVGDLAGRLELTAERYAFAGEAT